MSTEDRKFLAFTFSIFFKENGAVFKSAFMLTAGCTAATMPWTVLPRRGTSTTAPSGGFSLVKYDSVSIRVERQIGMISRMFMMGIIADFWEFDFYIELC